MEPWPLALALHSPVHGVASSWLEYLGFEVCTP
jgi:hypothetical protein